METDEFEIGGVEHGRNSGQLPGSKAVSCIIACEVSGRGSGRIRIEVIPDASGPTLSRFVINNVAPGATLHTDGWQGYAPLLKKGYEWAPRNQRKARREVTPNP